MLSGEQIRELYRWKFDNRCNKMDLYNTCLSSDKSSVVAVMNETTTRYTLGSSGLWHLCKLNALC